MNNVRQDTTDSVRIDKELMERIRIIAKQNGQTLSGYINFNLSKVVDRHWVKISDGVRKKSNV